MGARKLQSDDLVRIKVRAYRGTLARVNRDANSTCPQEVISLCAVDQSFRNGIFLRSEITYVKEH